MMRGARHGVGAAIVAVTLYATLSHGQTATGETQSCGPGLPPGGAGFADARASLAFEAKNRGYQQVCEADLERFRIAFGPLDASVASVAGVAFPPVALSGTPFSRFTALGALSEPDNSARSRLYRGFRLPDGHAVTLFEHDMLADGSSMARDPQDAPERINGLPARLDVLQAPSGKAISQLSWVERRRAYALWVDANVAGTPLRQQLFALAASLPPSVPACPQEIPPKPVRMGANGVPVQEAAPMTLSVAQAQAMREAAARRPCR